MRSRVALLAPVVLLTLSACAGTAPAAEQTPTPTPTRKVNVNEAACSDFEELTLHFADLAVNGAQDNGLSPEEWRQQLADQADQFAYIAQDAEGDVAERIAYLHDQLPPLPAGVYGLVFGDASYVSDANRVGDACAAEGFPISVTTWTGGSGS